MGKDEGTKMKFIQIAAVAPTQGVGNEVVYALTDRGEIWLYQASAGDQAWRKIPPPPKDPAPIRAAPKTKHEVAHNVP